MIPCGFYQMGLQALKWTQRREGLKAKENGERATTIEYDADEKMSPLRPRAAIAAWSRETRFLSCMLRDTHKCQR